MDCQPSRRVRPVLNSLALMEEGVEGSDLRRACAGSRWPIRPSTVVGYEAQAEALSIAWKAKHPSAIGTAGLNDLIDVAA